MKLAYKMHLVELPLTNLHVLEVGSGPPLIVVPATISELENWAEMMQFMGQWFTVYFFELPGHGKSTPFKENFSTQQVAQTIADFVDHQQFERFSLMGFSFGGILVMRAFHLLKNRVDHIFLFAPCLTKKALLLSPLQNLVGRLVDRLMLFRLVQIVLHKVARHPFSQDGVISFFGRLGKIERPELLKAKLSKVPVSTINVLAYQFQEVLNIEFPAPEERHHTPAFFVMSHLDPLLDYRITMDELNSHFQDARVVMLDFPYHQPPTPFTVAELQGAFGGDLVDFLGRGPNI